MELPKRFYELSSDGDPIASSTLKGKDLYAPLRAIDQSPFPLEFTGHPANYLDQFDFIPIPYLNNDEERRALRQSGSAKVFNGVTKGLGRAGTAFLGTFTDLIFGIPNLAKETIETGDFDISNIGNTSIERAFDYFNDELMEEWLPNYYTQAELDSQNPLRGIIPFTEGSGNFWGDKFFKNAGFTVGSIGAMLVGNELAGLRLGKFVAKQSKIISDLSKLSVLAREGKVAKGIGDLVRQSKAGTLTGSVGETATALLSEINRTNKALRIQKGINYYGSILASTIYESGVESRQLGQQLRQELEAYGYSKEEIDQAVEDAMNANFLSNVGILALSNTILAGKFLNRGFRSERAALNSIINKKGLQGVTAGKTASPFWKGFGSVLGTMASEGLWEEGGQYLSQMTWDDYYKNNVINGDSKKITDEFLNSLGFGFRETFGSKEGQENIILGALTGGLFGLGGSAYSKFKDKVSNRGLNIDDRTATVIDILNKNKISDEESSIRTYLNKFYKTYNYVKDSIDRQSKADIFLEKDDEFGYDNTKHEDLIQFVGAFAEYGLTDLIVEQFNELKGLDLEEFNSMFGTEFKDHSEVIDKTNDLITKIKQLSAIYESLQERFPNTKTWHFEGNEKSYNLRDELYKRLALIASLEVKETEKSNWLSLATNGIVNWESAKNKKYDANPDDIITLLQFTLAGKSKVEKKEDSSKENNLLQELDEQISRYNDEITLGNIDRSTHNENAKKINETLKYLVELKNSKELALKQYNDLISGDFDKEMTDRQTKKEEEDLQAFVSKLKDIKDETELPNEKDYTSKPYKEAIKNRRSQLKKNKNFEDNKDNRTEPKSPNKPSTKIVEKHEVKYKTNDFISNNELKNYVAVGDIKEDIISPEGTLELTEDEPKGIIGLSKGTMVYQSEYKDTEGNYEYLVVVPGNEAVGDNSLVRMNFVDSGDIIDDKSPLSNILSFIKAGIKSSTTETDTDEEGSEDTTEDVIGTPSDTDSNINTKASKEEFISIPGINIYPQPLDSIDLKQNKKGDIILTDEQFEVLSRYFDVKQGDKVTLKIVPDQESRGIKTKAQKEKRNNDFAKVPIGIFHNGKLIGFIQELKHNSHGVIYVPDESDEINSWTIKLLDNKEKLDYFLKDKVINELFAFYIGKLPYENLSKATKSALEELYNINRSEKDLLTKDKDIEQAVKHLLRILYSNINLTNFAGGSKIKGEEFSENTVRDRLEKWTVRITQDFESNLAIRGIIGVDQTKELELIIANKSMPSVLLGKDNSLITETFDETIEIFHVDIANSKDNKLYNVETGLLQLVSENDIREDKYTNKLYVRIDAKNGHYYYYPIHNGTVGDSNKFYKSKLSDFINDNIRELVLAIREDRSGDIAKILEVLSKYIIVSDKLDNQQYSLRYDSKLKAIFLKYKVENKDMYVMIKANTDFATLKYNDTLDDHNDPIYDGRLVERDEKVFSELDSIIEGLRRNVKIDGTKFAYDSIEDEFGNTFSTYKEFLIKTGGIVTDIRSIKHNDKSVANINPNGVIPMAIFLSTPPSIDNETSNTIKENKKKSNKTKTATKKTTKQDKKETKPKKEVKEETKKEPEKKVEEIIRTEKTIDDIISMFGFNKFNEAFDLAKKLGVKIIVSNESQGKNIAYYDKDTNSIVLLKGFSDKVTNTKKEQYFTHELLHPITISSYNNLSEKDRKELNSKLNKFLSELETYLGKDSKLNESEKNIIKKYIAQSKIDITHTFIYPLSNTVIASILNNIEISQSIKLKKPESFWNKLKNIILDLLKSTIKENSKLQEIVSIIEDYLVVGEEIGNIKVEDSKQLDLFDDKNKIDKKDDKLFSVNVEDNIVNYQLKSINILLSDKAKQIFDKGNKNNWSIDKILQELAIPKEQKELVKQSYLDGNKTPDDIAIDIASKYGFSVEINTAKGGGRFSDFTLNNIRYITSNEGEYGKYVNNEFQEITADEYQEAFDLYNNKNAPTQYYSNLSARNSQNVSKYKEEDGWEYQELRITTPLITPSIKGHPQFAEDNDIGWIRVWYNKKTGVVEIQEIQSDLFQKGREHKKLTGEDERIGNTLDDLLGTTGKNKFDNIGNQFLQLLNKDNNWVTFFIKSIIQDSTKKGYEKVLFPKGETAAKIEGHETIADEINSIDKDLIPLKEYKEVGLDVSNAEQLKRIFNTNAINKELNEIVDKNIDDKIKELNQRKQEFKSQGIEKLRPIEAFYEIKVGNILEKQYGKDNVKTITDEYNNQWREIVIDEERDLSNIMLAVDIENIKNGVDFVFKQNPELANNVYEALGFNQSSVEEFKGFWSRQQVANQQDKVFLFGDNTSDRTITKYVPSMTQAVIRGLPNAIGIDTKKDRGTSTNSYLTNEDFEWFKRHVNEQIQRAKNSGKTIIIPADGIGTGKAMLKEKAPKLFEYLQQELNKLKKQQITPQQKQQAQQLYSQYLDTIFPNSKVKDIFHHWSIGSEISEVFGDDLLRVKGIWLSKNPNYWKDIIRNKSKKLGISEIKGHYLIINSKKIWVDSTLSSPDKSKFPEGYDTIVAYNEAPNDYSGDVKPEFKTIDDFEIVIKSKEQIHILGSKADIQGFKEFVDNRKYAIDIEKIDNYIDKILTINVPSDIFEEDELKGMFQGLDVGDNFMILSENGLFNLYLLNTDYDFDVRSFIDINGKLLQNIYPKLKPYLSLIKEDLSLNEIKDLIELSKDKNKVYSIDIEGQNFDSIIPNFDSNVENFSVIERLHINKILSSAQIKIASGVLNYTLPSDEDITVKDLILRNIRFHRDNPSLNEEQTNLLDRIITELSKEESKLWNEFKGYFKNKYKIELTDEVEGLSEFGEKLLKAFEDTEQFKKNPSKYIPNIVKFAIASCTKLNNTAIPYSGEIGNKSTLNDWISKNTNRNTLTGLAEPIDFEEVFGYLLYRMKGASNIEEMIERIYESGYYFDKSLLQLYYKLKEKTVVNGKEEYNNLAKAWYTVFNYQSPDRLAFLIEEISENDFNIQPAIYNKNTNPIYNIAKRWSENVIRKMYNGLYKKNYEIKLGKSKSVIDDDNYKLVINYKDFDDLSIVIKKIIDYANELGIELDEVSMTYALSRRGDIPISICIKKYIDPLNKISKEINANKSNEDFKETNERSSYITLADTIKMFRYNVSDGSSINIKGNLVYSYYLPSFLSDFFKVINNPNLRDEYFQRLSEIPQNQASNWLWNTKDKKDSRGNIIPNGFIDYYIQTINGVKQRVFKEVNHEYIDKFIYNLFDGTKNLDNDISLDYQDMDGNDWNYTNIVAHLSGMSFISSVADGGHTYLVSSNTISISDSDFKNGKLLPDSLIHKAIYRTIMYEYIEMQEAIKSLLNIDKSGNDIVITEKKGVDKSKLLIGKHWDGKYIVKDGIPTGRVFKFLNMFVGTKSLSDYINERLVADGKPELFVNDLVDFDVVNEQYIFPDLSIVKTYINDFINDFVNNEVTKAYKAFSPIINDIQLLINNKEKEYAKYYSDAEHLIREFILNNYVNNVEMNNLWIGSKNEFKDIDDYNKRAGQQVKNGVTSSNYSLTMVTMEDYKLPALNLDSIEKVNKSLVKVYKDMEKLSDSLSFMTFKAFKLLVKEFGKENEYKDLIEAIESGKEDIDYREFNNRIQQLKYFIFQREFTDLPYKQLISHQIKNSIFVLFPQLVKGLELEDLHNFMIKHKIDQINSLSTEKIGNKNYIKLINSKGRLSIPKIEDISKYIYTINGNNIRLQQEKTDAMIDHRNGLGVQIAKNIFTGISFNKVYKIQDRSYTGRELFEYAQTILSKLIERSSNKLLLELGAEFKNGKPVIENDKIKVDAEKIRQVLEEVINIEEYDYNKILSIAQSKELKDLYDITKRNHIASNFPVFTSISIDRFLSILTAKFTKEVTDQKFPGAYGTILPNIFFGKGKNYGKESDIYPSSITYINRVQQKFEDNGGHYRLGFTYLKEENIIKAEILISPYDSKFYNEDGSFININDLDEAARTVILYKIPTEVKASMIICEVVGFIKGGGSQIVVPDQWVTTGGVDFDFDTAYTMQKLLDWDLLPIKYTSDDLNLEDRYIKYINENNLLTKEDKETIQIKTIEAIKKQNQEWYEEFKDIYQELLETDDISDRWLAKQIWKENIGHLKDSQRKLFSRFRIIRAKVIRNWHNSIYKNELLDIEEFSKLPMIEQNSTAALQNELLDTFLSILGDKKTIEDSITPNKYDDIQYSAKEINSLFGREGILYNWNSYTDKTEYRNRNIDLRKLKGNSLAFDGVISILGMIQSTTKDSLASVYKVYKNELKEDVTFDSLKKKLGTSNVVDKGDYYIIIDRYIGNNKEGNWTDINGVVIYHQAAQVSSNILDAVKFPMSFNLNKHTIGVYKLFSNQLISHKVVDGKDIKYNKFIYADYFIHQPIVLELSEYLNNNEGLNGFNNKKENVIDEVRLKYILDLYLILRRNGFTYDPIEKQIVEKGEYKEDAILNFTRGFKAYNELLKTINSFIDRFTKETREKINNQYPYSLQELKDNINNGFQFNNLSDIDKIKFYRNQLEILDAFEIKDKIATSIVDHIVALGTDKNGPSPNFSSIKTLNSVIGKTLFYTEDIKSVLPRETKRIINDAIKLGELDKVLRFLTLAQLDAGRIYTNVNGIDVPVTQAIYPKLFNVKNTESKYKSLEAYYDYSNNLAHKTFGQFFITETDHFKDIINSIILNYDLGHNKQDHELIHDIEKWMINYIASTLPFFMRTNKQRVLGIEVDEDMNLDINDPNNFEKFQELSFVNKYYLIINNPIYKKYINHPSFGNSHIINLIQPDTRRSITNGYDVVNLVENSVDINRIIYSFNHLYYNNNPYLRSLAEDLIRYAFITNGLTFGRNFSKYIPFNILYDITEEEYERDKEYNTNKYQTNKRNNYGIGYAQMFRNKMCELEDGSRADINPNELIDLLHQAYLNNTKINPIAYARRKSNGSLNLYYPTFNRIPSGEFEGIIYEKASILSKSDKFATRPYIVKIVNGEKVLYKRYSIVSDAILDPDVSKQDIADNDYYVYYYPVSSTLKYEYGSTVVNKLKVPYNEQHYINIISILDSKISTLPKVTAYRLLKDSYDREEVIKDNKKEEKKIITNTTKLKGTINIYSTNDVQAEDDGVTHINVYSKGKTKLGRLLSNFANTPITIGDDKFLSVESWWYWIKMNNINNSLLIPKFSKEQLTIIKSKIGNSAKSYFRELEDKDTKEFNPTKEQLKKVYKLKLEQNKEIKELLLENSLPFSHYYMMNGNKINANDYLWTVDLWREIKEELQSTKESPQEQGQLELSLEIPIEIKPIEIFTTSDDILGRKLTNTTWLGNHEKLNFDIELKDTFTLEGSDLEIKWEKPNKELYKKFGYSAEAWFKQNTDNKQYTTAEKEQIMQLIIEEKLRSYPSLVVDINNRGGAEFLKQCTYIGNGKNVIWEGKGLKSRFIKVLFKAYNSVLKNDPDILKNFKEKYIGQSRIINTVYKHEITFQEDISPNYSDRTLYNILNADVTVALYYDKTSKGELLTESLSIKNKKPYFGHDLNIERNAKLLATKINKELESLNKDTIVVNFAGNSIVNVPKNVTQAKLDKFLSDLIEELYNISSKYTIRYIRSGGQTGIDEAAAKGSRDNGYKTVVLMPKDFRFRTKEGLHGMPYGIGTIDIQTNPTLSIDRFKMEDTNINSTESSNKSFAVDIEGIEVTDEERNFIEASRKVNVIDFTAKVITNLKALENIYNKSTDKEFISKISEINTKLKDVNYQQLVQEDKEVILNSLQETVNFIDATIGRLTPIVDSFKNYDMNKLVHNQEEISNFTKNIRFIYMLTDLISSVDRIEQLYTTDGKEDLSLIEEQINLVLNELKELNVKVKSIKNDSAALTGRFYLYRTIQYSSNPKYKAYKFGKDVKIEDYETEIMLIKDLFENNEDITKTMLYLDSAFVTGVTFVDNLLKRYILYIEDMNTENRKLMKEWNEKFTKAYGKKRIPMSESEKIAKWFKDNFAEKDSSGNLTGRLITQFRWNDFFEAREKYNTQIDNINQELSKTVDSVKRVSLRKEKDKLTEEWINNNEVKIYESAPPSDKNKEDYTIQEKIYTEVREKRDMYGEGSKKFRTFLRKKHYEFDENKGSYYKFTPSEKYINSSYSKLVDSEGNPIGNLGEFYLHLISKINELMILNDSIILGEGFIPIVADINRTNAQSFVRWMGWVDAKAEYIEHGGINDQLVNVINVPFLSYIHKPGNEPIRIRERRKDEKYDDYDLDVIIEVEKAGLGTFESVKDIIAYNKKVMEENRDMTAKSMSYDINNTMRLSITQSRYYKYRKLFEDELLLAIKQFEQGDQGIRVFSRRRDTDSLIKLFAKSMFRGQASYHTIPGEQSNVYERLVDWTKNVYYETPVNQSTLEKAASVLKQFTSLRMMAFNITAGFTNVVKGSCEMLMEGGAKWFIDMEDLKFGMMGDKGLSRENRLWTNLIIDHLANIGTDTSNNIYAAICKRHKDFVEFHMEKGGSSVRQIKNAMDRVLAFADTLWFANNSTEYFLQYSMLFANMHHCRIVDGKILSFKEYLQSTSDEDVRLSFIKDRLSKEQLNDLEDYIKFRQKIEKYKFNKVDYLGQWLSKAIVKKVISKELALQLRKEFGDITHKGEYQTRMKTKFDTYERVIDQFELVDGYAEFKKDSKIDSEDYSLFIRKVKVLNHSMQGIYNFIDRNKLQNSIWGELVLQFRKWMRPAWNRYFGRRFGKAIFNENTNTWDKGAFPSLGQFITSPTKYNKVFTKKNIREKNVIKAFGNLLRDYGRFVVTVQTQWSILDEFEKANVRRANWAMFNMITSGLLVYLVGLAVAGLGDDEDEKQSAAYMAGMIALYEANGIFMQNIEMFPVLGWYGSVMMFWRYPTPTLRQGLDTWKLMYNLFAYPFRDEEERTFKSGIKAGKDKLTDSVLKNIPIYREYYKWENIPSYINYYKMYNPFLSIFKN